MRSTKILATIASTQDAAAKKGIEMEKQHQLLDAQASDLKQKYEAEMSRVVEQQKAITNQIEQMTKAVEVELKPLKRTRKVPQ